MKELNVKEIENQISYHFNKPDLLYQAFTRKSYAQEKGGESNEVLEFYGDEVLDFYVAKILADRYGYIRSEEEENFDEDKEWDEYVTINNMTESDLTRIKQEVVDNKNLARIISRWGFQKYLYLGKGDQGRNVQNEEKVKADLFEAILGAVAIDSEWNPDKLENTVGFMLNLDFYFSKGLVNKDNYVSLIQNWWQKRIGGNPEYEIKECKQYMSPVYGYNEQVYYEARISLIWNDRTYQFKGEAYNKQEARYECAKNMYEFLEENNLLRTIKDDCPSAKNLTTDNAINTLQELAQKGWISMPKYDFDDDPEYDENGNAFWWCQCDVGSHNICYRVSRSSKKEAKKCAAYSCICHIMGYKNKYNK